MKFKHIYVVCIYVLHNIVNGEKQAFPQHPYDKKLFDNVQISDFKQPYALLPRLLAPEQIFKQLFDQGGVNVEPMQICSMDSLDSKSDCTQSLCEIFLEFYESKQGNFTSSIPDWAIKMWDSSGRLRSPGEFDAQFTDLGRYDACIDIEVAERIIYAVNKQNNETKKIIVPAFKGKYSRVYSTLSLSSSLLSHPETTSELHSRQKRSNFPERIWNISIEIQGKDILTDHKDFGLDFAALNITDVLLQDFILGLIIEPPQQGLCVPSTCTDKEISDAYNKVLEIFEENYKEYGAVKLSHVYSSTKDSHRTLTTLDKCCIAMISVFVTLVVLGTFCDFFDLPGNNKQTQTAKAASKPMIIRLLICFSIYTNGKKILSTKKLDGSIDCVHGIRFFSMCWVVMGHTWFAGIKTPPDNIFDLADAYSDPIMMSVWSGELSVDTFFFLSGFLVAYSMTKTLAKMKRRVNIIKLSLTMYLHRYIRLTPAYACLMLVFSSVILHVGQGPNWILVEKQVQGCTENWWKNLLYINNMFKDDKYLCMGVTWYLACDFQLFLFAPFVVWFMWKFNEYFVALCALAIACIIPGTLTWYYGWGPFDVAFVTLNENLLGEHKWMFEFYYRFYNRAGPYVVGLLLGFFMYKHSNINRTNGIKIPWYIVVCGWIISSVSAMLLVYGVGNYYQVDLSCVFQDKQCFPTAGAVLYAAFARPVWAVVVGWIIFACHAGYGGPINTFLSWPGFFPLSRLTYCLYLIHLTIMFIFYGVQKSTIHYDGYTMIYFFFGNLAMCSFAASISTLLFESPFIGLEKIIFGRTSSLEKDQKPLTSDKEITSNGNTVANTPVITTESTSIESENRLKGKNHEGNSNSSNEPGRVRKDSYKQKDFDNTAYQP